MTFNGHDQLNGAAESAPSVKTALIAHVDIRVESFLGEATMTIGELNALRAGSVLTLDTQLNDAVELRVNGVAIAFGELVAVGDKFGVRITSLAP